MSEIKTILFATDYSAGSERACTTARTLAQACGARLVVLHVVNQFTDPQARYLSAEVIDSLIREVETHAVDEMRRFAKRNFDGLDYETEVQMGRASEEILRCADKVKADLIVMGTQGRAGLEKLFVGSTAEKILRKSRIPVLTVRD
ncbi:universal stress protein [Thiohalocapsa sp. ML1]|jgi:nucleotide-binding universal stress UspA family protein|uniref:universal stress protein n=1 Tax=Thiohalocapsa sp. ML1 TaxID=1431688 RepID=UPI0007321F5C|nr:universal stress protein [Thiohalocapsa sp. ML1]